MARKDVRTLRDEAATAATEGKHKRALECYIELEQREPQDPNWPKRAAEVYRRLGKNREAVAAYDRAAERYVQGGFLVQAIAVSKIILQIDPSHETTKHRLASITDQQEGGRSQAGALAERHGVENFGRRARPSSAPPPSAAPSAPSPPAPAKSPPVAAPARRPAPVASGTPATGMPAATGLPAGGSRASAPAIARPAPGAPSAPPSRALGTAPPVVLPTPAPTPPGRRPAAPIDLVPAPRTPMRVERNDAVFELPDEEPPPAPAAAMAVVSAIFELPDDEAVTTGEHDLDLGMIADPAPRPVQLDPGAPLDSVALAGVFPGAQPERRDDGSESGIIVIPLDDDDQRFGPADSLEIHAVTVGPDNDSLAAIPLEPEIEPEELELDDLADLSDLAEPRPYSAAAQRALAATPLFAGLPPAALEQLIERLALVELPAAEMLFQQGDPGSTLYVVVEGEVAVLSEGPPQVEVSRLGPGTFFGEVALVTEQPRSATILATEPTQLLAIDREVMRQLIGDHPEVLKVVLRFLRERLVDSLVQTHPMFEAYGDSERRDLISRFRFLEIEAGALVLEEGKRAPGLYALLAGTLECRRGGVRVTALGPGDLFGEVSVLTGEPSDVTVIAGPRCLALCLPSSDFREIIMTHPQVLSYIGDVVDERKRSEGVSTSRVKLV